MSGANPYEAPIAAARQGAEPVQVPNPPYASGDDEKIIRYAQLGLRLLGVMFLVDGAGGMIGSIVYAATLSTALQRAGIETLPDAYTFGWFASSVASLVAGFYFVIGGRWVLEKVFLSPSRTSQVEDNDADASSA